MGCFAKSVIFVFHISKNLIKVARMQCMSAVMLLCGMGMITEEMLQEYGCDRLEFKKTGQTALDEMAIHWMFGCCHLQLDLKRNS